MKAIFVAGAILLLNLAVNADTQVKFDCVTVKNLDLASQVRVLFRVSIDNKGQFHYVDDEPFHVSPKNSQMSELNENGTIHQDSEKVEFFGDGDGFVFVYLDLFKTSHYHAGYARVKDGGGGTGNFYSPVKCQIAKLK